MDNLHYGNFNELVEIGFAYLRGQTSIGIFEETVNRVFLALRDGQGKFKALELPLELKSQLRGDLVKVEEGFKLFNEGIQKVKEFVDLKDKNILWQGLSMIQLGCDLLNDVARKTEPEPGES